MSHPFSIQFYKSPTRRRWLLPVLSVATASSLVLGSTAEVQAFSLGDLLRGGVQVIQGIQLSNMSPEKEVELGKDINEYLIEEENLKISDNERLTRYVNNIGQRLVKESDRPDIPYTFQVVEDDSVNAFATMGGYVYVHTGLIREADNEAQLASVIAHEIGHIAEKHALQQMSNAAIQRGIITASGIERTTAIQLGAEFALRRPRSREHEYEADRLGADTLGRAGYAQWEMIQFFEKLAGGASIPEFLSTHPDTENRIERLKGMFDPETAKNGYGTNRNTYQSRLNSLM
jgi:predicted Zn-dependent protease